ncbi:MAG: aminotransferase class V-fold PLP-dependent enzyme [Proteobacteria bacterium]|nr:aminotransferase class V-fold PLP-dependent enzyme [Pseudomonadota bacterium]
MARMHPDREQREPRAVARELAAFAGTTSDHIALVENATTGVQAVLNSLPFGPGDHILITDHQYNAVRLGVEARCRETGATPVVVRIPLPTTSDDIVERILAAADARVRLVILDHITSPSALVLPVERLIPELRRRGIPVLIDGAHAIGQLPLQLDALGADWYVSNMHKWALRAARQRAALCLAGRGAADAPGAHQPLHRHGIPALLRLRGHARLHRVACGAARAAVPARTGHRAALGARVAAHRGRLRGAAVRGRRADRPCVAFGRDARLPSAPAPPGAGCRCGTRDPHAVGTGAHPDSLRANRRRAAAARLRAGLCGSR